MPSLPAIKCGLLLAVSAMVCLNACSPKSPVSQSSSQPPEAAPLADPAQRDALELQRIHSLVRAGAARAGVYRTPSDEELKAEYRRFIAHFPPNEFHVAQILVPTERMAKELVAALQSGTEFGRLASEESTDAAAAQGGDLGWVTAGTLAPALTRAIQTLKPGQFTLHPIHTEEGWHIVKLLQARSSDAPPLDQVKAQLVIVIEQRRYEQFLSGSLARSGN